MPPFIANLLGAGLRLIANAALVKGKEFIRDKTGVDLDQATLSPDDQLKLQQFEAEHEEELLRLALEDNRLGLEETKAYLADVSDARRNATEIATSASAPWYSKAVQPALAGLTVILTFLLFGYFVYVSGETKVVTDDGRQIVLELMPQAQKDLILYILGVLSTIVTQIFAYYFGSSSGSKAKSDTLDILAKRKEAP